MSTRQIDLLQDRLLAEIRTACSPSAQVLDAFRSAPRHMFLPDAPLDEVYKDSPVVLKRESVDGPVLVTSSQPSLMLNMLAQLDLQPGHRVLEVGAGTGYNAALIGLMTPGGTVTSIDVESDVLEHARQTLCDLRIDNVYLETADGWQGYSRGAPYDRVIFTANMPDIPSWVFRDLAEGGIVVVPLSIQNQKMLLTLNKRGPLLVLTTVSNAYFIDARGQHGAPSWHGFDDSSIVHDALTDDERECLLDLLELPFTAQYVTASSVFGGDWRDFGLYLALSRWLTIDVSSPRIPGVDPGAAVPAIADIAGQSISVPAGYFGGVGCHDELNNLATAYWDAGAPSRTTCELRIAPKGGPAPAENPPWRVFNRKQQCDIYWRYPAKTRIVAPGEVISQ